ncbi:MAG TPA: ABC transporter permease [Holophagaceae bacterium]|nr:ABC transporter permease [Holophagaceae bacterium]
MNPASLLWRQFKMEWTLYSRDRGAMFWTFLFPVLMLLGFGVIFRGGDTPKMPVVWVNVSAHSQALVETPAQTALRQAMEHSPIAIQTLTPAEAEAKWQKGETAVQLEPTADGFHMKVNSYLIAQGQMTAQVVQQAFLMSQAKLGGQPMPKLIPVSVESPGHAHETNYAAFLLPGLLGLNLMSMGLFAVGMVIVSYREKGKFRRLAVTPLPKWVFLLGQILHRLTVVLLQSAVLILVGAFAFHIHNQGSYFLLSLVMALGTACFMALGFALTSFAETSETYGAISNLVFFPLMFLSGVYFTLDAAPKWLQTAVIVLPLSPFLKALRAVFNDGAGLQGQMLGLGIVAGWTLIFFGIAVKRFRWA